MDVGGLRVALRLVTIEAVRSFARNKVRTALAALAIMIGVSTVICVVAIGRAGADAAVAELDALGDNLVWLEAGSRNASGVRTGNHGMTNLLPGDADAIRSEVPLVSKVSENVDGRIQVMYGGANWLTQFRGVSPEYLDIKRWTLVRGEFFSDEDVRTAKPVVVIGDTVRRQLFDDIDPIGEQIRINSTPFVVVGVLRAKGVSMSGQDQDDTMMMPWTTARARILGKNVTWLDDILCSAVSPDRVVDAASQVSALIRDRHHIAIGADDDFNIRHPEELLRARIKSARTLELFLFVIASTALLIGGIGIMNVMLASVAQRTREIGVRVAVGAKPWAIRIQFLGEAVALCLGGGLLGLGLSVIVAPTIGDVLGWEIPMSASTDVVAIGFSAIVGMFFGYYPATRAAGLDPIVALRAE
ncbi:MAG TPA: ABC transporter permease [Kofleriaceae bacterium]|nr:ABC transporter permease [Kofleriaceae bacterium]